MDTYICMTESLHCSPKTITTLLISYTPIKNKKLKRKKNVQIQCTCLAYNTLHCSLGFCRIVTPERIWCVLRMLEMGCHCHDGPLCVCVQLCLTLCDPMDCNLPGSSFHRIFQTRILEWVIISCFRTSSWTRDWTCVSCVSCTGRQILNHCATWEAPEISYCSAILIPFC